MIKIRSKALILWTVIVIILAGIPMSNRDASAASLDFAGRTWNIKQSNSPVGPGPNLFSASPNDVWSDQDGLHLSIHKNGPFWYSTEVILDESLGYGTYMIQTDSRQDILNANAVFGAFTWDSNGGSPIPGSPNREIDFEDSRFGNAADSTNSQVVVQPFNVPGNLERFTLPDLSSDAKLTRFFTWSPGKVEFTTLKGHHSPTNFPPADVIHQYTYLDDGVNHFVPIPDRENYRMNLWLFESSAPVGDQEVEVLISDFQYLPLPPSDNTVLFDFESGNQSWGSFGAITTGSGELPTGGSIGQGRFHTADYSDPNAGFGIVDISPAGQDLSTFLGLSVDALFEDVDGQPPFVGTKELEIIVETPSFEEFITTVTMTDEYQTFSVAFEDFQSGLTSLPPTPTQLSDVAIKLVVRNESGTGFGDLHYDQITGLNSIDNADFDADLEVDGNDFLVWQRGHGNGSLHSEGDANNSLTVDGSDLSLWENQYGSIGGSLTAAISSVPEPASSTALLFGLVGVIMRRLK